jgi:hypothetical protein
VLLTYKAYLRPEKQAAKLADPFVSSPVMQKVVSELAKRHANVKANPQND